MQNPTKNAPISDLPIDQHLLDNKVCEEKFNINPFMPELICRGIKLKKKGVVTYYRQEATD